MSTMKKIVTFFSKFFAKIVRKNIPGIEELVAQCDNQVALDDLFLDD